MCFCGRAPTMDYCGTLACEKAREDAFQHETSASPEATGAQPTPKGQGVDITPLVIADLQARSAQGAKKYGEPLRADNGRDALMDAYQEALDLVQYLRQLIEERKA